MHIKQFSGNVKSVSELFPIRLILKDNKILLRLVIDI